MIIHFRCAVFAAIVSLAGCSGDRPDIVPVSGRVLIDGRPLTHGVVQFVPHGSRASYGNLDAEGRFQLTCREPNDGAVIGHHSVGVSGDELIDATNLVTTTKWHAPKRYADPASSGLTQEISVPVDELTIDLSWDGGEPFIEKIETYPEPPEAGLRLEQ